MSSVAVSARRLFIAIEELGGGGAERVALSFLRHCPRTIFQPVLVVSNPGGSYIEDVPPDVEVINLDVPSSPRLTLEFLKRLGPVVQKLQPCGVLAHMTGMNRMMLRAKVAGVLRCPVVVVEHNNFRMCQLDGAKPNARYRLLQAETALLYRMAHRVVGCSYGVTEQLSEILHLPVNLLCTIPNPLDERFMVGSSSSLKPPEWIQASDHPIITSIGRLVYQKGFDILIKAFSLLPHGTLVILGDGPLLPELLALAEELNVRHRTIFAGFISDPEKVLYSSDVFVSTSRWEGYPLALLEAFACGLPVVAKRCRFGPDEIVIAGRPGRLVDSDDPVEFAEAIVEILHASASGNRRFPVDLRLNDPSHVATQYCNLFAEYLPQT